MIYVISCRALGTCTVGASGADEETKAHKDADTGVKSRSWWEAERALAALTLLPRRCTTGPAPPGGFAALGAAAGVRRSRGIHTSVGCCKVLR